MGILGKHKILVLAPHTDDGEFGCGGTIARFIEEGADLYYAAFSVCEQSVPDGWPKDILKKEVSAATSILGVKESNLITYGYPVRYFCDNRQAILEDLVKLKRELNPDLVLAPTQRDIHQDHQIMSNEAIRAFKSTSILAYEMPWNNMTFSTQTFVRLEERHLNLKIEALACYESQKHRPYASTDFIKGWCMTRGVSCGARFAEAFEVVRWII